MNKVLDLPPSETDAKKERVVIFGSFYRGYHILSSILNDEELMKRIEIVGVVTDDPSKVFSNSKLRVWRHDHLPEEETMVERLVEKYNKSHGTHIPVYKGRVKPPAKAFKDQSKFKEAVKEAEQFREMYVNEWKPDVCYMGTFGPKLDEAIIDVPPMGFYNCHPSDGDSWPSLVGPQPFEQLFKKKHPYCAIALHHVNTKYDDGDLCAFSEKIPVPYDELKNLSEGQAVIQMHRVTSPFAGELVVSHLRSQLGMSLKKTLNFERFLHDPSKLINQGGDDDSDGPAARTSWARGS